MADLERGERIKGLREARRLSQPAVIDLLEKQAGARVVTLRGYQAWEAGGGIRWENVKVLGAVYGVDAEWIMSGDRESETPDLSRGNGSDDDIRERLARMEAMLASLVASSKRDDGANGRDADPGEEAGS